MTSDFKKQVDEIVALSEFEILPETVVEKIGSATLSFEVLKIVQAIAKKDSVRRIVEFGSGLSTFLFAELSNEKSSDYSVVSFESSLGYYQATCKLLANNDCISTVRSAIRSKSFFWKPLLCYDPNLVQNEVQKKSIDFVLIDGPKAWLFGREATLYQVAPYIKNTTWIILDDANREFEQYCINEWKEVFGDQLEVVLFPQYKNGLAFLRLIKNKKQKYFPFSVKSIWKAKCFNSSLKNVEWKKKFISDNI